MKNGISRDEALAKLKDVEAEMKKLKEIIESPGTIIDRINDLDDIYEELEIHEQDVILFKKAKTPREKYLNSCAIIPMITKAYNEGEELDWNNSQQTKYLPIFEPNKAGSGWVFRNCFSWCSSSYGPSGHHFKKVEHLRDACNKFKQIYSDYYSYKG